MGASVAIEHNPGLHIIMDDIEAIAGRLGNQLERFSGKTVLITGAGGVLASYLADTLAYASRYVTEQSIRLLLLTRTLPPPYGRLAHLLGRDDVEFIVQDARDPLSINAPLHFVIHAASPATPGQFRADPVGTVDANSLALRQLLALAHEHKTENFLFFSSSEIYGSPEPENIPTPETYIGRFDFTANRSCYAEAKRFGETLCASFFEQYKVPVKVTRPFHVHGPGLRRDDGRIIAEMICRGLDGAPLELLSDGTATRTYGYVADATVGFLKILLSDFNGHAFNIGADEPETSVLQLTKTIAALTGRTDPVIVKGTPRPQGSPDRVRPDLTKIRTLLGYTTEVGLEDGLDRTIRWFKAQKLA